MGRAQSKPLDLDQIQWFCGVRLYERALGLMSRTGLTVNAESCSGSVKRKANWHWCMLCACSALCSAIAWQSPLHPNSSRPPAEYHL